MTDATPTDEPELAPHRIETARSSRSRCRTCRKRIEKDTLRLGVLLEGPYGTGYLWHHLTCAARRRSDDVEAAYAVRAWDEGLRVPPLDELRALKEKALKERANKKDPPYLALAPTGRAKCRHCDAPIEKGAVRVTLLREVSFGNQVRSTPIHVHAACAAAELRAEDCLTEVDGFADALHANSDGVDQREIARALEEMGTLE